MNGNYPEGVTTYDIDKNFGPCCSRCGEPVYAYGYRYIDDEIVCDGCYFDDMIEEEEYED